MTTSFTSVSWIPSEAVAGFLRLPLDVGLGHYDQPPPPKIDDLETFVADGRCRFANRLRAWAQVEDGRIVASGSSGGGLLASTDLGPRRAPFAVSAVRFPEIRTTEAEGERSVTFVQTAGGRTGAPCPRRLGGSRRFTLTSPTAWTTLSVTIDADGSIAHNVQGASTFPRHFFYDHNDELVSKSATIDFDQWTSGLHSENTPWGDSDSEVIASSCESGLERTLSVLMMQSGPKPIIRSFGPGEILMRDGELATSMALVLDGLVEIEVSGRIVANCGPGSVLGERAFLEQGARTATVRAATAVKTAETDPSTFSPDDLAELRALHRREVAAGH